MNFLPILLGSDENVYSMARAFHMKYGVTSVALAKSNYLPTRYSKIVDVITIPDFDREDIFVASVVDFAQKKKGQYSHLLLIPCSDRYMELSITHRDAFAPYFANGFISPELLEQIITKDRFYALLEQHGVDYPKTVVLGRDGWLSPAVLPFPYPIIVKAANSNSYDWLNCEIANKKKAYYIADEAEYNKVLREIHESSYNGNMLVQEYVPGDDTAMRVLNCYSDENGKVRMMCLGHPVLEEYTPSAIGNYAAIITDYNEAVFAQIKAFLEEIHYVGFSNFDMKYDEKDGKYKLFEINPRQGRSSFFVTASGCNLAQFLVENAIEKRDNPVVFCKNKIVWSTVPLKILYQYVQNKQIIAEIRETLKKEPLARTLVYDKDASLYRRLRVWHYYHRHYNNYKTYFIRRK